MAELLDKKRKQDLGIFYTDESIVNFIYDILLVWKEKEDKESQRWESRQPHFHFPSVIDPACGEGVFLKRAIETGFTGYHPTFNVPYVFGVDLDEAVMDKWEKVSLLELFKNNREAMRDHFYCQNGLVSLPERNLPYKKQEDGLAQYDAVVGNPPYGGVGLGETKLTNDLIAELARFEVLPASVRNNLLTAETQASLFRQEKSFSLKPDAKRRIKSFPIEILFLERFIQLAKPGGWISIIIPDGILANSSSHYVREFIIGRAKVEAIVSLPRDAFKNVGTSAKTSILFLQKLKDQEKKQDLNYPVFLASVESLGERNFKIISDSYKEFYYQKT